MDDDNEMVEIDVNIPQEAWDRLEAERVRRGLPDYSQILEELAMKLEASLKNEQ